MCKQGRGHRLRRVSFVSCSHLYFDCCDIFIGGNRSLIVFSHTVTLQNESLTLFSHDITCFAYTRVQLLRRFYYNNRVLVRALFFFFTQSREVKLNIILYMLISLICTSNKKIYILYLGKFLLLKYILSLLSWYQT